MRKSYYDAKLLGLPLAPVPPPPPPNSTLDTLNQSSNHNPNNSRTHQPSASITTPQHQSRLATREMAYSPGPPSSPRVLPMEHLNQVMPGCHTPQSLVQVPAPFPSSSLFCWPSAPKHSHCPYLQDNYVTPSMASMMMAMPPAHQLSQPANWEQPSYSPRRSFSLPAGDPRHNMDHSPTAMSAAQPALVQALLEKVSTVSCREETEETEASTITNHKLASIATQPAPYQHNQHLTN